MPDLIQKAVKGWPAAMLSLYEQHKSRVFSLCRFLLIDDTAAESAAATIFKNLWYDLTTGRVSTEDEFLRLATRKTAIQCKVKTAKSNSRAFHTPANANFAGTTYHAERMDFVGEPYEVVLKNLPAYHRFIYVLHTVCGYSPLEISKIFNTTEKIVGSALEAERGNISRIVTMSDTSAGNEIDIDREGFHTRLLELSVSMPVPASLDATVNAQIQTICEPIRKREEKKRNIILASVAALLVIIGIVLAVVLTGGEDSDVDLDNADLDLTMTDDADDGEEAIDGGSDEDAAEDGTFSSAQVNATHYADIEIEGYGTITVALDGDAAPETVANFVALAEEGFYDGLTFHRIDDGFMMQGGDPNGDGTGGSDTNITGEFSANGFENNISHTRGTISMARSDDYNSASSQFFIVHEDSDFLDGQYAAFGRVTEGMDIVDAICTSAEPIDSNSLIAAEEQPVITSITIRAA